MPYLFLMLLISTVGWQNAGPSAASPTVGIRGSGGIEGTGAVVAVSGRQALVLTAAHLVGEGDSAIQVTVFGGTTALVVTKAKPIYRSPDADIAFLRLEALQISLSPVKLAPARAQVGPSDPGVRSIGCDRGFPVSRPESILGKRLLTHGEGGRAFFWQARDPSIPGRSGGPLLNSTDELLGICSGYQAGKGYYTHIDEIRAAWKRALAGWPVP